MLSNSKEYVDNLIYEMAALANSERAKTQAKYMRNQFTFFGVTHPEIKKLARKVKVDFGYLSLDNLFDVTQLCFQNPHRELHHLAILLNEKMIKQVSAEYTIQLEWMITHQSWWDSVDYLSKLTGLHFKRFPDKKVPTVIKWIHADNIWLNRVAIIFQLSYRNDTDEKLLYEFILMKADSKEFFIQKACGWALRQYSKTNPDSVHAFIKKNSLSALTKREGMKHLIKSWSKQ